MHWWLVGSTLLNTPVTSTQTELAPTAPYHLSQAFDQTVVSFVGQVTIEKALLHMNAERIGGFPTGAERMCEELRIIDQQTCPHSRAEFCSRSVLQPGPGFLRLATLIDVLMDVVGSNPGFDVHRPSSVSSNSREGSFGVFGLALVLSLRGVQCRAARLFWKRRRRSPGYPTQIRVLLTL